MLKRLLFTLAFLSLSVALFAQTPTTQGTEFWLSFMRNGYRGGDTSYEKLILIASAKRSCVVTVSNPITQWEGHFVVPNQDVQTYIVSDYLAYNDQLGGIANTGLFVTATDTISLYIANEANNSYDAANVLPVQALGAEYMIQTNKSMGEQGNHYGDNRASFLVIATEDNTKVQIIPTCTTYDDHAGGQPYEVTLNRGQCYHTLNKFAGTSANKDGDFSGTLVTSEDGKPIAVFNGNSITSVPGGLSEGYDHVVEQAMPTDHWGKRFVVTSTLPFQDLQDDLVKVTALEDQTTVMKDGQLLFQLNAGESNTFQTSLGVSPCTYLESDHPIAVYLYQHSHGSGSNPYGDPSMVWISPVEQTLYEITFSTFNAANVHDHFVNVVCYTDHVSDMTLDGTHIGGYFHPVPGAPQFSYVRYGLEQEGAHVLQCPGGLVAHVYGVGVREGYAYTVGSSAKILTKQLYVDDILSSDLPDGYEVCQNSTVRFRVETNYEFDHVEWDFGDEAAATGAEVSHPYLNDGDYDVMAVVYRDLQRTIQPFDTLTVTLHVNPVKEHDLPTITTCGTTYWFHGIEYSVPGDYEVPMETHHGCDSIVHLHLLRGTETMCVLDPVVHCGPYVWFGTSYTETNHNLTHRVPNATPEGCDSIYFLDLTIGYPPTNTERTLASCFPVSWHGQLCETTGVYHHTFTTAEGCEYDSVLHFTLLAGTDESFEAEACDHYEWMGMLYEEPGTHVYHQSMVGENGCENHYQLTLTLHQSAPFSEIVGRSQVAVATNFWPGEYLYQLNDSAGLDLEILHWELLDNPGWKITPCGASCVVKTLCTGVGTLRAWTEGYGECDKEVTMTIRCSGYAVEEDVSSPLELYPNPAEEVLFVKGEGIDEVVVYTTSGQRVMVVKALEEPVVEIHLQGLAPALYFVEVKAKHYNKTLLFSVNR